MSDTPFDGPPAPVSDQLASDATNNAVPVPYTAKGTPVVSKVPHNGANFHVVEWPHRSDTYRGTVIYVHGFAELSGIYTEFFDRLSERGYDIFFFDQRGAGETSKGKEYGRTEEKYQMGDLDFFIEHNAKKPGKENEKFILMGHLMGGGIVLNYAIKGLHSNKVRSVVANGPMVQLHPATAPNAVVTTLSSIINRLTPNLKIDSKLDIEYVTLNKKWQDYIKAHDSKFIGTIRLFYDMIHRGGELLKPEYLSKWPKNIPLFLIHGSDDKINWVEGTKKFFALLPSDVDKTYHEVPNGRHSTFVESEDIVGDVLNRIDQFLQAH